MVMPGWVRRWLQAGTDRARGHVQRRKLVQLNAAALLVVLVLVGLGLGYLASGNPALRRAGWNQLPLLAFVLAIPALNRRGMVALARWGLLLGATFTVASATVISSGSYLEVHTVYIVIAMAAGLIFPLREWPSVTVIVLLNVGLYLHAKFVGIAPPADLLDLPAPLVTAFRLAYVGATVAAILFMAWVGDRLTDQNERLLEELSGVDPLTGLANRRRVTQRLTEAIVASHRFGQHVGVLFFDLDNFKPLNDRHGHDAGDALLREVARRLETCVRKVDMAGRLGGDEFAVVVGNLGSDREEALRRLGLVAEGIRERVAEPYRLLIGHPGESGEVEHRVTASIGAAVFLGSDADPDSMLQRADAAMYRAKAAGRNRVEFDVGG